MHIHHVACVVISHADVAAQGFVEAEMIEGVFSGEVWCAEIEIPIGDKDLEILVEGHGLAQCFSDVDILILEIFVRPIHPHFFAEDLIRLVCFKFQFGADVIIECCCVWA